MPGDGPTMTIWCLYQGLIGKEYAEHLRWRTAKERPGFTVRLSSDGDGTADGVLFDRIREDCRSAHAAIAVVSYDSRAASSAGNLWLELGLWLASRDQRLLCICRQKHREVVSESLISDLSGKISGSFSSKAGLWTLVRDHLDVVRDYYQDPARAPDHLYTAQAKIFDTFAAGSTRDRGRNNRWLLNESYCCYKAKTESAKPCASRLASLEFAAELLRMGRANHERSAIQDCLRQIGSTALLLTANEDVDQKLAARSGNRFRFADMLAEGAAQLRKRVDDLLMDSGRCYPGDEYPAARRFSVFIGNRLSAALTAVEKQQMTVPGVFPSRIRGLRQCSPEFYEWLTVDVGKLLEPFRQSGRCSETLNFEGTLMTWGSYCLDTAAVLDALGRKYFDDCRCQLKKGFARAARPQHTHEWLRRTIDGLPHHGADHAIHLPIWPKDAPALRKTRPGR